MSDIPQRMRGVHLPGDSTAVVRDVEVPEPGPGELLVRVGASGICGSDIGYIYRGYKGHRGEEGAAYRGVVAGHEPAGTVVAAGPQTRRFGAGDRILAYHIVGCGVCHNCRGGWMISCTGSTRAAYGWQRDGGHADYILVDERTAIALPDELSFVDGALIACGFGTAYEGLHRLGVTGADDVVVVGLGPVGLAAAMIARGMGARRVIGIEPSAVRRGWADGLDLFDATVHPDDAAEAVAQATSGVGAQAVIDCSGSRAGRSTAIESAAEWGRVSLVGEGGTLETEVSDALLHKQLTLYASWVTSVQGMERITSDLVRWGLRPEAVVSDRFDLDRADDAYRLAAGESRGKVVLIPGYQAHD
ncbi:zinc-binding dehydrogenase [Actinoallomurus spadix]|uniref:Zinc-binding dehydrogenase n=1 Tax=Actinoallomurus spadix TaxID=79912 RepID=A0ABN0WXZ8_9ACTN|nr:zinc-binding dehydrogenase [Actinoallomurus spadix]MCO5989639.1 zinc-binding dehydrogenase [Actinoallomurus spadix]